MAKGLTITPRQALRFHQRLAIRGECLVWTGPVRKDGYAKITIGAGPNRKGEYIHRVAFALAGGILTEEKPFVLHSCDNRICCKPAHLKAGTPAENMAERDLRHRQFTVINQAERLRMRRMKIDGFTVAELSAIFGISEHMVRRFATQEVCGFIATIDRLEEENRRLREENASLNAKIDRHGLYGKAAP